MKKPTKKRVNELLALLDSHYPDDTRCFLSHEAPWQLMVATILSAQCTDARVNSITPGLFYKYPSPEALASAELDELSEDVKSTGFYHSKAKNIMLSMQRLVEVYKGQMPSEMEALTAFPGVGRKTANVILNHVFDIPGVVVDTHVKRISYKLGLTENTEPEKVEYDLMGILPREHWIRFNTQLIAHGRAVCRARSPQCGVCPLGKVCPSCSVT